MLPGRRQRFDKLLVPVLDRLYAAARRRCPSVEVAEDLVQEVYLRAWQHLDELQDTATAYTWLYRILLNLIADYYRKEHRRQALLPITTLEEDYDAWLGGADGAAVDDLVRGIEQREMQALLEQLPQEFADALTLHHLDGLRYREIATLTRVPLGTVMSRISRGRKLLAALVLRANRPRRLKGIS